MFCTEFVDLYKKPQKMSLYRESAKTARFFFFLARGALFHMFFSKQPRQPKIHSNLKQDCHGFYTLISASKTKDFSIAIINASVDSNTYEYS